MSRKLPEHLTKEESNKSKANNKERRATRQINSGSLDWAKGDIVTDDTLIEHKFTSKDSFRITKQILDKLKDEAMQMSKEKSFLIIEMSGYRLICKVDKE